VAASGEARAEGRFFRPREPPNFLDGLSAGVSFGVNGSLMNTCDDRGLDRSGVLLMFRISLPLCVALAATLALFRAGNGLAARTADEAKAFAERAVAHIQDVGRDKAFADFSRADGGYVDGELYMFCYAADGTTGWVDFRWPNPVSKKIEAKSAYVIRVDAATVCGSGYYKG